MERDRVRHQRAVGAHGARLRARGRSSIRRPRAAGRSSGQSTVEYAIVCAGVLALVVGLGVLLHAASDGAMADHVLDALSHRLPKGVLDVFAF